MNAVRICAGLLFAVLCLSTMPVWADVTVDVDAGKPIKAVREAFRDLKRIYRAAGAEKRCHLVVGDGGHRFYAERAWPKMLGELARIGA